jgi:hypothetical protein
MRFVASDDPLEPGLKWLRAGEGELAAREFDRVLQRAPQCSHTRQLLLEAHRCRSTLYWMLRGYWRCAAGELGRLTGAPLFVVLCLAAVAAECAGGYVFLGCLPSLLESNFIAQVIQVLALIGLAGFIAVREEKLAWLIDNTLTTLLVPNEVRERCLEPQELAEGRRAAGYALGVALVVVGAVLADMAATFTDRADDLMIGALGLGLPIAMAVTLPGGRTRSVVLLALALLAAITCSAREPGQLGDWARLAFFVGFVVATPLLIVLHVRASRRRSARAT